MMGMNQPEIMIDVCAKFYNYLRIKGWLASNFTHDCDDDKLTGIKINADLEYEFELGLPSPQIGNGLNKNSRSIYDYKTDVFRI